MRHGDSVHGWSRALWVLGLAAFALRVAVLVMTGRLATPETWEYETIATNLVEGRGFVYPFLGTRYASFTGPVYPALCALVYAITDHNRTILVLVQAVLSASLAVGIAAIGRELFGGAAGLAAGVFTALHPGLLVYTTKLHPLILDAWLFSFVGLGWLRLRHQSTWPWRVWVGLALGAGILSRPTLLVCVPLVVGWYVGGLARAQRPRALRVVAAVLLIAAGVVLPWTLRNYRVHQRLVFVQSTTGLSFWKGNNPQATGGNLDAQGRDWLSRLPPALREQLKATTDETEHDRLFWRSTGAYVRQHPWEFAQRFLRKLVAFWWLTPQTGMTYPAAYRTIYQLGYVAMVILALVGLWQGLRDSRPATRQGVWLLVLLCGGIAVAQSVFYVEGRHRWAIEPLLLVVAGAGSVWLANCFLARDGVRRHAFGCSLAASPGPPTS